MLLPRARRPRALRPPADAGDGARRAGRFPCPVYDNYGYDYWQQLPDGRVALGGGRSLHADAEWGLPAEPGDDVQAYLDVLLRERLGIDAPVTHRWAGRIAYTPSGCPSSRSCGPA